MYTDFAAKLCHNLIEDGFYVASQQKDITEYTPLVILMKNQSPVLYVVNIINADFYLAGYFESQSRQMFGDIEKNMNSMYCASCVSVNILVSQKLATENRGYCDEKPMITGEKISGVWWTADLNNNELYAGKEQPDRVVGIERAVKAAFSAEEYKGSANVDEIEKTARLKSLLPVVSRDISFTYALMFFNVFIFLFVHFSGNESRFLQQFACSGQLIWQGGEFYRLFTAMFFHSGWEHIIFNVFSIYIFASRCELYMGRANTIAVYFASGIAASVVSSLLNTSMAVGASGAICGILGAILVFSRVKNKEVGGLSYFTILLYSLLVIGFGILSPGVDNYAHAGGFIAGILLQLIIEGFKNKKINNAQ